MRRLLLEYVVTYINLKNNQREQCFINAQNEREAKFIFLRTHKMDECNILNIKSKYEYKRLS